MLLNKSMMVLVTLALFTGIVALGAGAASAGTAKNSNTSGYVVIPVSPDTFSTVGQISPMVSQYSIVQGQTNWHTKYIGSGCPGYYADLNWGNPSNSLQLTIFTPDGATLGPYYDSSDGQTNGRILLYITKGGGNLPVGTYYHEVYGLSVSGVQYYTF